MSSCHVLLGAPAQSVVFQDDMGVLRCENPPGLHAPLPRRLSPAHDLR